MTLPRVEFLSIETVLRLHEIAIADQGGEVSIRDRGLLDSALAMPRHQFEGKYLHSTVPAMAGAYAFHIAKNHPFVDGNKRAAFSAMVAFMTLNGWRLDADPVEAEQTIVQLAAGKLDKDGLTLWIVRNSHEKPRLELRDFFQSLDWRQICTVVGGAVASGSEQEASATLEEADRAIPLAGELRRLASAMKESGEEAPYGVLNAISVVLVGIYRVAEDRGYEW